MADHPFSDVAKSLVQSQLSQLTWMLEQGMYDVAATALRHAANEVAACAKKETEYLTPCVTCGQPLGTRSRYSHCCDECNMKATVA